MNVETGAEAALFPEKEYINGIAVAVWATFCINYVWLKDNHEGGGVTFWFTPQTIIYFCILKKDLTKHHFYYEWNISKTESSVMPRIMIWY